MTKNVHERKRKAKCFLSLCSKIDVTIEAVGNTLDINPERGPEAPVRVAHLVNLDRKKVERFFGLLPRDSAEYDLWVSRKPENGRSQWTLVKVSHTSNSVTAGQPRDLNYCHLRASNESKSSNADFAEYVHHGACDYEIPGPEPRVNNASLFSIQSFTSLFTHLLWVAKLNDGWIDCNNGCCT